MITLDFFTYTEPMWDAITVVVRDALGLDADQEDGLRITRTLGSPSIVGIHSMRSRIEMAASLYLLHGAAKRRSPRGVKLAALRKSVEKLQASIIGAIAVPVGTKGNPLMHPLLLHSIDADMLTATNHYFRKLIRNLDRMITQAGSRRESARKTARNQFWNELLAIWCELGGRASGKAAASFLMVASKPVMRSAVPDIPSIVRWLERHR